MGKGQKKSGRRGEKDREVGRADDVWRRCRVRLMELWGVNKRAWSSGQPSGLSIKEFKSCSALEGHSLLQGKG